MLEQRINRVLQRALSESSRAQALCATLANRNLAVNLSGSPWGARLFSDGVALRIQISRAAESHADTAPPSATISGSALSLLGLMGASQRTLIQRGEVQIAGDGEVAQKFAELAALLKPDVEHELAGLVGRTPAHLLWNGVRGLYDRGRALTGSNLRNAAEYLAHERRDLVPQAEADHFYRQVDQLREQVDRIEASINHLEQRQ
jgi:ubiquinone biosynthesis protein UbiJ